jgi:hypothetical protein
MHRAVMKLIIVFLMSVVVGASTPASAAVHSHASFEAMQTVAELDEIGAEDAQPGHPTHAGICHDGCSGLVVWHWPVSERNQRVHCDKVITAQLPGSVRLILPPPRSI